MSEKEQETFTNYIPEPGGSFNYEKFTKLGTYKMGLMKIKDATKAPHPQAEKQEPIKGYRWVFRSFDNPNIFVTPFTSATISTGKQGRKSNLKILLENMSEGKLKDPTPDEAFDFMSKAIGRWWDMDISVKKDERNPEVIYNNIVDMGVRPSADKSSCLEYFKQAPAEAPTNTINEPADIATGFEEDDLPESFTKSDEKDDEPIDVPF